MSDWNSNIIEEFRANQGRVGGGFAGAPLLLLHHQGARTGTKRVSPLMYQEIENGFAVFASKGGAATNPDWFHNVRANPITEIEIGSDKLRVNVRVASGPEQEQIWSRQKVEWPQFAEYEKKTKRSQIPVVILEPVAA